MPEGIEELTQDARRVKPDCCGLETGSRVAPRPTRVESLGSADWSARVCARFPGEEEQRTRGFVQHNPRDQRSPGSLAPPLDVCFHESEFLEAFADGHDANVEACLRRSLGMSEIPAALQVLSTLALSSGGLGSPVHTPFQVRCSLGQLG